MTGTKPVFSFSDSSQDDLNPLRRICFTGVRGVGKSTVMEEIDVIFTHMDYEFYTDIILLDSYPERIQDHRQRDTKKK
ncbi:hypothetical protein [Methanolobus sp. ZRKC5]|uniref:hypothetical protein n=1 Tax=unclassified Methanolobus TaxID=2629569 RepID=UPI00313B0042